MYIAVKATQIPVRDLKKYEHKAAEQLAKHIARKSGVEREMTKQVRKDVMKRVYLVDHGGPRRLIEFRAKQSEVSVFMKKSQARLEETLYDVDGFMQQELFYVLPQGEEVEIGKDGVLRCKEDKRAVNVEKEKLKSMQRFRYFQAKRAVYNYENNTLIAYDARFWTYCVPGHKPIYDRAKYSPESTGTASALTLYEGNLDNFEFSAEHIDVQFATE
jgi:hypothetical protein